jgi:hypothetical protein
MAATTSRDSKAASGPPESEALQGCKSRRLWQLAETHSEEAVEKALTTMIL